MANSTSVHLETSTRKQERNTFKLSDRLDWAFSLKVSSEARFVALAILKHTGSTSGVAWPSRSTIQTLTGYSLSTVKRSIRELEAGGHFTVQRLKIGGRNASNRYRFDGVSQTPPMGSVRPPHGVSQTPEPVNEPVSKEPVRTPIPPKGGLMDSPALIKPRRQKRQERNYRLWWSETHSTPLPDNPANWPQPYAPGENYQFDVVEWFETLSGKKFNDAKPKPKPRKATRSTDRMTFRIDQERRARAAGTG